MTRFRAARRAVRRALGLSTRPGVDAGTAYVCDYVADWYRAHPGDGALQTAEEWENWRVLPAGLADEIVRAAAWWPLLRGPVRVEVESAVADGIARRAGAER
jgi:hypothetical protein